MTGPSNEPSETLLRPDQRSALEVRRAAYGAALNGVPQALAEAEVRFAYRLVRRR